jgi:hypothetical protein
VRAVAVLVAAVLVLAGCGSLADPLPVISPSPPPTPVVLVAEPTAVRIPALNVSSSLTRTGLNPDQTIEVPPVTEPMQASWFDEGGRPGMAGYPAVVLGHVSGRPAGATRSVPGVFARLGELKPGDGVFVDRADGSVAKFVVERVELFPKDTFPTDAVYDDTAAPTLRLITCGGEFDSAAHSYRSNIVVFARLVP